MKEKQSNSAQPKLRVSRNLNRTISDSHFDAVAKIGMSLPENFNLAKSSQKPATNLVPI